MTAQQLIWDFSPRCFSISYLNLTITLDCGWLSTNLYKKVLDLYLHLPPHSGHPPGVLKGLILVKQIYRLTTHPMEHHYLVKLLFLQAQGYPPLWLAPIFCALIGAPPLLYPLRQILVKHYSFFMSLTILIMQQYSGFSDFLDQPC